MNASYVVEFSGFSSKAAANLDKMIRAAITAFPDRLAMASATVKKVKKVEKVKHGKSR